MEDIALITYCGLCCLDCHSHAGKIPDLARDLRKELRRVHYEKFAEALSAYPFGGPLKNYQDCYDLLGLMMKFRCTKGCRAGGGPPFCRIRECCREKDIAGCWECSNYPDCEKLDYLNAVHGDAHRKNLARIRKKGVKGFLEGKRDW